MTSRRVLGGALVAAIAFSAGAVWAQLNSPVAERFRAQVAAFNAQEPAKLTATYAGDAVSMAPNAVLKGSAAIQSFYEQRLTNNPPQLEAKIIDAVTSGDLGYVTYTATESIKGKAVSSGHGVVIYRRIDGEWKTVVEARMGNEVPVKK